MTLSELIKLAVKMEKKYGNFPIKITVIDREKTSHNYNTSITHYKYKTIDMVDLDTTGIEEEGDKHIEVVFDEEFYAYD